MHPLPLMLLLALLWCSAGTARSALVTVHPDEDTLAILHNPDMGWVLYENYPLDSRPGGSSTLVTLPGEDFSGVDNVALMFSWFDIEKHEGEYDFSKVDYAYDYWKRRGKQIQLRMSTESLLWWTNTDPPTGKGVPDYLLQRLPDAARQTRVTEGIPYTVVDAREPCYQERLHKFLAAVAMHFNGARPVTLVDLRGFGLWGEWHSGFKYPALDQRHQALRGIIDAYANAFPGHYLALSYSYDPDSPKTYWGGPTNKYDAAFTSDYEAFLHYSAFDYALTKPNVTWRRDGVGGAVHSNERKLSEEAFWLQKGPMMDEFLGGYGDNKKGGQKRLESMMTDALSLHPNYINLMGYQAGDALAFVREQPALVAQGLREMGYRLVPTSVTYPASIRCGVPFSLDMQWVNRGVGRAMRDYRLRALLAGEGGATVAACDAGATDTARCVKGQVYPEHKEITFHGVVAGRYQLRLALTDPMTQKPITLPLRAVNADGSYALGAVTCAAPAGNAL